jgi:hypothetical protein
MNLVVHRRGGRGRQEVAIGKCKVLIRRLTLAPGAIGGEVGSDGMDADVEEAT